MMRAPASRRILPLLGLLALLTACKTQLNAGLTERQANEETALLLRDGIPASRDVDPKTGSLTVWVEQSRFADAVDLLREHGLPAQHFDTIADVFKGNGLIVSPTEERARMIYALGEELSRTISEIDGVLAARVQIVIPDNDPLRQDASPASASVFVRYKPDSHVDALVPQIKMLVAGGVSGLAYDKVSVVLVPAVLVQTEAQPVEMEEVYGIWAYRGSAEAIRLVLAGAAGMFMILLCLASRLAWRSRHRLVSRSIAGSMPVLR
jgi:type III secretion protein J